jgi:hypothetical protein
VLLVHGAFADGSMWAGVITDLQAIGIVAELAVGTDRVTAAPLAFLASRAWAVRHR